MKPLPESLALLYDAAKASSEGTAELVGDGERIRITVEPLAGTWCPVYGMERCKYRDRCVGSVCVAANGLGYPVLNRQQR